MAPRLRLGRLGKQNAEVVVADGLALPSSLLPFDRILIHARLENLPSLLVDLLSAEGRIVMARPHTRVPRRQMLVELRRDENGEMHETEIGACRLQALLPGVAEVL